MKSQFFIKQIGAAESDAASNSPRIEQESPGITSKSDSLYRAPYSMCNTRYSTNSQPLDLRMCLSPELLTRHGTKDQRRTQEPPNPATARGVFKAFEYGLSVGLQDE